MPSLVSSGTFSALIYSPVLMFNNSGMVLLFVSSYLIYRLGTSSFNLDYAILFLLTRECSIGNFDYGSGPKKYQYNALPYDGQYISAAS